MNRNLRVLIKNIGIVLIFSLLAYSTIILLVDTLTNGSNIL